ncbi:MAG TPA: serine hydrolase domain-containing protein, partial [Candidatus Saccharimonadales bacterium]|nr:serine hydrolase domain-containing protein [Candidatus Saccharimonadales bacterium]
REKVLSVDAVGFADIANKKAMKPDALFWIASQTKPMTAVALMMLVDEGKLTLDDAVEKHLPEFRGQTWLWSRTKRIHCSASRLIRSPFARCSAI